MYRSLEKSALEYALDALSCFECWLALRNETVSLIASSSCLTQIHLLACFPKS